MCEIHEVDAKQNESADNSYNDPKQRLLDVEEVDSATAGGGLTDNQIHHLIADDHNIRELGGLKNSLLSYMFLSLLYIGLNLALLIANFHPQDFIEANYYLPFHLAGFWGVFLFSMLEAIILISTDIISWSNISQAMLILVNVMVSFSTAVLFSMDPKTFEVVCHYMEYSVQILISGVNVIFVMSYFRHPDPKDVGFKLRHVEIILAILVLKLSIVTLVIYSGVFTSISMGPERAAHFCEFTNEICNGLFTLAYAGRYFTSVRNQIQDHCLSGTAFRGTNNAFFVKPTKVLQRRGSLNIAKSPLVLPV